MIDRYKSECFNYPQSPSPVAREQGTGNRERGDRFQLSSVPKPSCKADQNQHWLSIKQCVSTILSPQAQLQEADIKLSEFHVNLFQLSSVPKPSCKLESIAEREGRTFQLSSVPKPSCKIQSALNLKMIAIWFQLSSVPKPSCKLSV